MDPAAVTKAFTDFGTQMAPVVAAAAAGGLTLMFVFMGPKKAIKFVKSLFGMAG